jgi:hypothetical protein
MEKILGNISFFGAISIVFIGVLTIVVRGNPTEQSLESAKTMEEIMLVILAISGMTTLGYILKSGAGKGTPDL